MEIELKNLKTEVSELKSTIKTTDKKLDRIIYILDNDLGTGQPGLVSQVQDIKRKQHTDIIRVESKIDEFLYDYKKSEAIKQAKAGVIGAIAGGIVAFFGFLLKTFVLK